MLRPERQYSHGVAGSLEEIGRNTDSRGFTPCNSGIAKGPRHSRMRGRTRMHTAFVGDQRAPRVARTEPRVRVHGIKDLARATCERRGHVARLTVRRL